LVPHPLHFDKLGFHKHLINNAVIPDANAVDMLGAGQFL
jgi:hypothetical protein